ncbi:MAG: hypothetical protein NTW66_01470 [Candidatus Magasanikbacteria bacterium]|nr:hypothetical protein [Candidatus Magasanikbacteria bacterium]
MQKLALSEAVRQSRQIAIDRITANGEHQKEFASVIEWHAKYDWEAVCHKYGIPVIDPGATNDGELPDEIAEQLRGRVLKPGMIVSWHDTKYMVVKIVDRALTESDGVPHDHDFCLVCLSAAEHFTLDLPH